MTDEELDAILDALPYQRIPGLPYTHEERIESLRKAEENIAAGRTITWDDLKKEIATW